MLKLEDIASFVAVAEVGSISAAARRGGWSKSVVSSRLAALEEDLGARLFHRTTRRLSLTEDGAAFLVRARRLVQDVDEAVADMAERRGELAGPMRPPAALRVNNGDMMRDAALAGLGLAMLPSFIVGPDIRAGTLKVVDIGLQAAPEYLYVAHPEGRKVSAKLRALVDWLRTAFGDPPYWEVGEEG